MTDIFTNEIKDLLKLVTEDFDAFYKETEKKSKSSGDSSTAASSGYYSTAASSGDSSKAASSGDFSKAASSGDYSKAASSGYYSTAASSGNYSTAASSGDSSTAASSGYYSTAASSGDSSTAASSGNYSTAASSGDSSKAASSGNYSTAASSGDSSKAASSGYYSTAASSGNYSACSALGYRAAVMGDIGNLIMCSEYNSEYKPVGGLCAIVDGKIIKEKTWYIVQNNKWVEVDFTDGIFSYVLSSRQGVKKLKTERGDILYCVQYGDVSAHGNTIKEARDDLSFKLMSKDVDKFKGMKKSTKKTPGEWAMVYRAITGACRSGTEIFVKNKGKLKTKYTLSEILDETKGAYGHEAFKKVVLGE